jgi:peptidoglycan hydrolase-like protein with peptidoglycan-binding domain
VLKNGSRGEDVQKLQKRLHKLGIDPGPIDGVFGPKTEAAVRGFQTMQMLEVDGIAGPKTLEALKAAVKKMKGAKEAEQSMIEGAVPHTDAGERPSGPVGMA